MNLDRIKKKCYNNNKKLTIFEKYLVIMIIEEINMLKNIAKGNRVLERVVERIMEINENYDEWVRVYDVVEENNRMWRTIVENTKEEEKQNIIKNLLKQKLDINLISKVTDMSVSKLKT